MDHWLSFVCPGTYGAIRRLVARTLRGGVAVAVGMGLALGADLQPASPAFAEAETDARKIEVAAPFRLSVFGMEPQLANPVAISVDGSGRVFVSETHRWKSAIFDITKETNWLHADLAFRTVAERAAFLRQQFSTNLTRLTADSEQVRLVEDLDGDGRADRASVFATGFNSVESGVAAGVLALGQDVWFTSIPDLWHFRAPPGKTNAPTRRQLSTGYGVHIGVSGHDLHGLCMGPDGRIYFSVGDRGAYVRTREGTLIDLPDMGAVFRCEPDGRNLEVFCIGLRNPQELVFDALGNLWTDDNDTAGPDDSRLLHLVQGADYGWRCSYQHMAGFGPWVQENLWRGGVDGILPPAGVVAQGPAGLAFNPGRALSAAYEGRFFACDFPGGIWSFSVKPSGATFVLDRKEKFLWGLWPTDLDFAPDGTILVADWVGGWTQPDKGRLYRVVERNTDPDVATARRLALEPGSLTEPELVEWLSHHDLRVRLMAQWELARRGPASLTRLGGVLEATGASRVQKRHALWGLAQIARNHSGSMLVQSPQLRKAVRSLLVGADPELQAQAARAVGEGILSMLGGDLVPLLEHPVASVRFEAAMALGRLKHQAASDPLIAMLLRDGGTDLFLRHSVAFAFVEFGSRSRVRALAGHPDPTVRLLAVQIQRRTGDPQVNLEDPSPAVVEAAVRAVHDVPFPSRMAEIAAIITRPTVPASILSRVVAANRRVGQAVHARSLGDWSSRPGPAQARVLAIDALAEWAAPSGVDPVVGLWRPIAKRSPDPARLAVEQALPSWLRDSDPSVPTAGLSAAVRLGAAGAVAALLEHFPEAPPADRIRLVQLVGDSTDPRFGPLIQRAMDDSDPRVQAAAISKSGQLATPGLVPMLIARVQGAGAMGLRQAALAALARQRQPEAADAVTGLLTIAERDGWPRELELELDEALGAHASPELQRRFREARPAVGDREVAPEHRVLLFGGDAGQGRRIVLERGDVQCLRCHQIGGNGGPVGPPLDKVGSRMSREALLESVLFPNRAIAPGFEDVVVRMKDQSVHVGRVIEETPTKLKLRTPEGDEVELATAGVEERRRSLSAMPEELGRMLTPRELRDVVAFLSGLR